MGVVHSDELYLAAASWKELLDYSYRFTYGYKMQLHEISLSFSAEDFPHLAGFQYLRDVTLPKFNPRKTVDMILNGKIDITQVKKGFQFESSVKPRLEALIRLKKTLDQEFLLYSYMPRFYPFTTRIKADYLISTAETPTDFYFIIKENSQNKIVQFDFMCCSAFTKDKRDYREGQRTRTILKKERIYIPTSTTTILYDQLATQQSKTDRFKSGME